MDSSAIDLIQKTAIAAEKANHLDTFTPAIFHNGDAKSLEPLLEGRTRFRGIYTTDSIDAFASYVTDNKGDNAGFIDVDSMSAKVFFNLGTVEKPGHGDWTGLLKLRATAEFQAIMGINGKKLTQRDLIDWMEDWGTHIVPLDRDGAPINPGKAVAAIRKLTIKASSEQTHQEKDFGARRSAIEDIEATADEGIPYALGFAAVPYAGLKNRSFTLRLSVLTGSDKPQLVLRIVGIESANEAIAEEFRATLTERIGDSARLLLGSFKV